MKVAWGVTETKFRESAAALGHELHVFRMAGPWINGVGRTNRVTYCKRCMKVFRIIFCPIHGFHLRPEGLHGECESSSLRQPAA
jgi:hypothetical protein